MDLKEGNITGTALKEKETKVPKFSGFKTPKILCLLTINGGGSKLLQSYLDGHPGLYNIPAYPMLYFYPHWKTWERAYAKQWSWQKIIDLFCVRHASVIDSRRIMGFNGLDTIGKDKNEHVEINEQLFRFYLQSMLKDQPIKRKTFILAVNYAYALCKNEDIGSKSVLLWHHHHYLCLDDFISDFPNALVIGMIRDARPVVFRCYDALLKVDEGKLNESDCMLYRSYAFYNAIAHTFRRFHRVERYIDPKRLFLIRHEDLKLKLESVMRGVCRFLDIPYADCLLQTTFDGKLWWGHAIYNMPQVTGTYDRVVSKAWQKTLSKVEVFAYEGIYPEFYKKYGYELLYYKKDSLLNLLLLFFATLWPNQIERRDALYYFKPSNHLRFLRLTIMESTGKIPLKDYTWNATYIYKWTYVQHRLSQYRWYRKFLDYANNKIKQKPASVSATLLVLPARVVYIIMRYLYFWATIILLPILYLKRIGIFWGCIWRRLNNRIYWPPLLGSNN